MDSNSLSVWKNRLKSLIEINDLEALFINLKEDVPRQNAGRYDLTVILSRMYESIKHDRISGVKTEGEILVQINIVVERLLSFINDLSVKDFEIPGESEQSSESTKLGTVLYDIPRKMKAGEERECMVRLAFEEKYIWEGLPIGQSPELKKIRRIESRMEVEIKDPSGGSAFAIRKENSERQLVLKDSFAEWLFFVEPKKSGVHKLFLKVNAIVLVDGEKERIEMVLREEIEVVNEEVAIIPVGHEMKMSGMIFTFAFPGASLPFTNSNPPSPEDTTISDANRTGGFFSSTVAKIVAIVGTIFIVGYIYYNRINPTVGEEKSALNNTYLYSQKIDPPFSGLDAPNTHYFINPDRDTTLNLPSGGEVFIPGGSITSDAGGTVSDTVEIRVWEIKRPHEIIEGGIPMRHFTDDGTENWLRTGGMFRIEAYYRGKPVEIVSGKSFRVSLISRDSGAYDFWKFVDGNWEKQDASFQIERLPPSTDKVISSKIKDLERQKQALSAEFYISTVRNYPTAGINFKCCPELKNMPRISLAYAGNNPSKESWDKNPHVKQWEGNKWKKMSILRALNTIPITYEMVWQTEDPTETFTSYVTVAESSASFLKKAKEMAKVKSDSIDQIISRLKQKQENSVEQARFRRTASIESLGLYNFDILLKQADLAYMHASFDFGPGVDQKPVTIYLITGDNRTVISYPAAGIIDFYYAKSLYNKLVAFLPDNKLAYFKSSDFGKIQPDTNGKYVFTMTVVPLPTATARDIDKVLAITDE